MYDLNLPDLKEWRNKFGVSQKKLAEKAKISLATLRQVEVKGNKSHRKTLRKVRMAIDAIERSPRYRKLAGAKPAAKSAKAAKSKAVARKAAKPAARRGRPPKTSRAASAVESVRNAIAKGRKARSAGTTPKPAARRGRPPKSEAKKSGVSNQALAKRLKIGRPSGSVQLNNIDLELINRVLSLKAKDKLALLDQLMK